MYVTGSGISQVSARSPCGILRVSSSTRLSKIRLSILSDGPSVPIRGSKFVGIDSIRKLTTPGSVATLRKQEEIESAKRSKREAKEVEEVKEVKEAKDKSTCITLRRCGISVPPPPLLPKLPLRLFLTCITHLAQHDGLLRSGRPRHVRRPFLQRLVREHCKGKSFLGISRHAKF